MSSDETCDAKEQQAAHNDYYAKYELIILLSVMIHRSVLKVRPSLSPPLSLSRRALISAHPSLGPPVSRGLPLSQPAPLSARPSLDTPSLSPPLSRSFSFHVPLPPTSIVRCEKT